MATYFVRPVGTTYGNSSGTSYANAFSGNAGIVWTNIVASDVLYVCGTHREKIVLRKDVVCRLDYTSDPGTIYGSDVIIGWTLVGSEWQAPVTYKPNVVAVNGVCLKIGTAVGSLTGAQYAFSGTVAPYTLSISVNPTGATVEVGQRARGLVIGGSSTDTFSNVKILGGGVGAIKFVGANDGSAQSTTTGVGKGISVGDDTWAANNYTGNILIDGVIFDGCGEQAFHFNQTGTGAPSLINITYTNNKMYQIGGESFYVKSCNGVIDVHDNTIDGSIGLRPGWAGTMDGGSFSGDGIDIGGPTTFPVVRIYNNNIKSLYGNGIVLATASIYGSLYNNTITDCYMPGFLDTTHCILLDMQSTVGGTINVSGNKLSQTNGGTLHLKNASACTTQINVIGNLLVTVDQTQSNVLWNAFNFRNYIISNNTIVGGLNGLGMLASADPTNVTIGYNIISGCDRIFYHTRTVTTGFNVLKNICNPTGLNANPYLVANTGYSSVSSLESARTQFISNSQANPLLGANYAPTVGSPCLSTGVKWWSNARPFDVNGEPYPNVDIDIGAIQSTTNSFHPSNIK
jgi:hypothetical protein